ncbi:MAG: hypothetical protein GXP54_08510 [Deltaproteobacteria bacterium]|nr:hypothetical protein [Deltaproteobacteria bacterium]
MRRYLSISLFLAVLTSFAVTARAEDEKPASTVEAATPAPAAGGAWSTQGGEIVPRSQYAGTVGVGYPGLRGMVHIPVLRDFEVDPTFWFLYAHDTTVMAGDVVSVLLKYRVYHEDRFHISLAADPGIFLSYYKAFGVGIQLGLPQLLMTYNLLPEVDLHFGFKMPISFMVHKAFAAWIPILFNFGAEYHFNDWINIYGSIDMGVDLIVAKGGAVTPFFSPNFTVGAAFKF